MKKRQDYNRSDRVAKALMRELSEVIAHKVKTPDLDNVIISVTDIDLSNDLRHAKVFISVLGTQDVQDQVFELISEQTSMIRSEVAHRVRLRYIPEFVFVMDDSLERGARVSQLLDKISQGEDI